MKHIVLTPPAPSPQMLVPKGQIPAFSPDLWLFRLFSPLAVAEGSTLRRDVAEVEANMDRKQFLQEVELRGYRAVEKNGQFTLTMKRPPVRVIF